MTEENHNRLFNIAGMTCGHCKTAVEVAIRRVTGVAQVTVDLKAGQATVFGNPVDHAIIAAVEDAGYEAKAVTPN